ncbi:MAG: SusE domain-containing protein [Chitinophagaceae bacterium]|nr:SusE domain-containing protein [Chitinophagaceae bacterium]
MKNKMLQYLASIFAILLFAGCDKNERDINLNVTPVPGMFAPADNKFIKLKPAANLTETFEWEQAKAEDGSLVLYEVAFDQAGGDFSQPFYTVVSDNRGVNNKLTLPHGELNKIATLGGSAFFEKKKFKWTVYATKGTTVKKSEQSRIIELERPGGFATLPGEVYITGTATEGGDALANALKMRQLSPGIFEIFTKLKAGTYRFVDGIAGTPTSFYTFVDNGVNVIGVNGTNDFVGADKIMRIVLDFNNINSTSAEVKSVRLWYCQGNDFWFTLPYTSNGVWRYNGWTVNLQTVPWGLEERYKYKMVINDGTGDKDLWINSTFGDPPGQDGQYPSSVAYRTIDLNRNNGSAFDFSWKFDRNYLTQGSKADFWVSLRGSDGVYTQNYQKQ